MDNQGLHLGGFTADGAFKVGSMPYGTGTFTPFANSGSKYIVFDASNSNSIYGNSSTVQPASLTAIYAIKY